MWLVEEIVNICFVEVLDFGLGMIIFGMVDLDDDVFVWVYFFNFFEMDIFGVVGDVWYNWFDFLFFWFGLGSKGVGSVVFEIILYEFGYVLGFKYLFEGVFIFLFVIDYSGIMLMIYMLYILNIGFNV